MGWIVGDGFDYYSAAGDVARSVWDVVNANFTLGAGAAQTRFNAGQSLVKSSGAVYLQKNMLTNEATIYAAVAFYVQGPFSVTTPGWYLQYRDGVNKQCTVTFDFDGAIRVRSGAETGTVLATFAAAYASDVWTHFQVRVVIDGAAGSVTIRKNGQTSDTFTATGLNTRGGSANNYANVVALGFGGPIGNAFYCDDLLFFSGSGAAPNTWVGDARAVALLPAADTAQKQFTPSSTALQTVGGQASTSFSLTANTLYFIGPITAPRSGALVKATFNVTINTTGHFQFAVYQNAGGLPGSLVAVSAVMTNPVSTGNNDVAFASGNLVAGRSYFIAILLDTSTANAWNFVGPASLLTAARAYASGFPDPAGTVTNSGSANGPNVLLSYGGGGNVTLVSELVADADSTYVFDATVGDSDLYDMDDLPFTPLAILGVVSKLYCKKSDAGSRNGQVLVKSGATQAAGADTVLSSTYTYLSKVDPVDPNTGAAWTVAGINALQLGQKVSA